MEYELPDALAAALGAPSALFTGTGLHVLRDPSPRDPGEESQLHWLPHGEGPSGDLEMTPAEAANLVKSAWDSRTEGRALGEGATSGKAGFWVAEAKCPSSFLGRTLICLTFNAAGAGGEIREADFLELVACIGETLEQSAIVRDYDELAAAAHRRGIETSATIASLLARSVDSRSSPAALDMLPAGATWSQFSIECDFLGNGRIVHSATESPTGSDPVCSIREGAEFAIVGDLKDQVAQCENDASATFQAQLADLPATDSLRKISGALDRTAEGYVVGAMLARMIPAGTCDVDPRCERKSGCEVLCANESAGTLRRPISLDLVIADRPIDLPNDFVQTIQFLSLIRSHETRHRELEEDLLSSLASLPLRKQRHHLRALLERCLDISDNREKGAAFERLTQGLLGLVPSWLPSRANVTDVLRHLELDLTIRIDPEKKGGSFWFHQFGSLVLVECKNYPAGLRSSKDGNPVDKLTTRMNRTGARLGLLVCTGRVPKGYYERTLRNDHSRTVCIIDGTDLRRLVDAPEEIDTLLQNKVVHAAAGLDQPESMNADAQT